MFTLLIMRLFSLYEATYRSFINVQILLVNSVQNVYKSQGVTISDKHIEVIIKQMSSKIQIMPQILQIKYYLVPFFLFNKLIILILLEN